MSYLAEKTAALAAGRPWPPPREDEQPLPTHDWTPDSDLNAYLWRCTRCGSVVLDTQRPPPGRCRVRASDTIRRGPRP